jgi:hypothetical protein
MNVGLNKLYFENCMDFDQLPDKFIRENLTFNQKLQLTERYLIINQYKMTKENFKFKSSLLTRLSQTYNKSVRAICYIVKNTKL